MPGVRGVQPGRVQGLVLVDQLSQGLLRRFRPEARRGCAETIYRINIPTTLLERQGRSSGGSHFRRKTFELRRLVGKGRAHTRRLLARRYLLLYFRSTQKGSGSEGSECISTGEAFRMILR